MGMQTYVSTVQVALCYLPIIRDMEGGGKSVHFFRNLQSIYFSDF